MKKILISGITAVFGGGLAIATSFGLGPVATVTSAALHTPMIATAQAVPGQCGGGYTPWGGGGFCDFDPWLDGSFMHWERVCVFGICGENTFRACNVPGGRVPTDSDPATPC